MTTGRWGAHRAFAGAVACLLSLAYLALAQPPADPPAKVAGLELPASQSVPADEQFVRLKAITDGSEVAWLVTSNAKTKWKPVSPKEIDVGISPGATIKVYGTAVVGGKSTGYACTVLTVDGSPLPGPPGPVPPAPDTLKTKLAAAWAAESAADKAQSAALLGALYGKAATSYSQDPQYKTLADLFTYMKSVSAAAGVSAKIPGVHKAAGDWLNAQVGTTNAPLDAAARTKLATAFKAVADALGELK